MAGLHNRDGIDFAVDFADDIDFLGHLTTGKANGRDCISTRAGPEEVTSGYAGTLAGITLGELLQIGSIELLAGE